MKNTCTVSTDKDSELAPIVLFVYNRLQHTEQTVNALLRNDLVKDSDLFVFSDAPSADSFMAEVQAVRRYIHQIQGFRSITIVERSENWGLARNIIDGVTTIVNKCGKIIVLEDDLITSKYFLQYMNEALLLYETEKKVMQISGYNFPIDTTNLPETYFFRASTSWGWATWKDRWKYFERDAEKVLQSFSNEEIYNFNIEDSYDFWKQIIQNQRGEIYTWAVFYYACIFKRNGLTLFPKESYVQNCGHDSSGTHCGTSLKFDTNLTDKFTSCFEADISESKLALELYKTFFNSLNLSRWQKIKDLVNNFMGKRKDRGL